MAKKQKVVITQQLYWPHNPFFWVMFLTLSGYCIYKIKDHRSIHIDLVLTSCFFIGLVWTRGIMKQDIEKTIGNLGTWVLDFQNIVVTSLTGISASNLFSHFNEQTTPVLHVSSAFLGMAISQIVTFYLSINILKMERKWYQTTILFFLLATVLAWYDPTFLWWYQIY